MMQQHALTFLHEDAGAPDPTQVLYSIALTARNPRGGQRQFEKKYSDSRRTHLLQPYELLVLVMFQRC